jgi:uncharacterized protein (DUF2336 family)
MIAQKLPEIFSLARDKSEPSRVRLAGLLADVFLGTEELNQREQLMVNDIIDDLVSNTSPDVKKILAERLSDSGVVPHRLLMSLANDFDIQVAAPVLKNNIKLKDEDLIFVVEAHGREHALAIAERKAVSEAVVDALVATGEVDVMVTVAENLGAKISSHAMHGLVNAARFARKLHEPLANRPELTSDLGLQMMWWMEGELRRTLVKRYGIGAGQVDVALENSINDLLANTENDRHDSVAMERVADWLEERQSITSRVMVQCLRSSFFKLFAIMLARKVHLDNNLVDLMISEDGGRSMSVLCRAIELDKPSFVSMFLLSRGSRPGEQIVNPKELSLAIAAFDKLDIPTARSLIEGWRRDPSYLLNRMKQTVH